MEFVEFDIWKASLHRCLRCLMVALLDRIVIFACVRSSEREYWARLRLLTVTLLRSLRKLKMVWADSFFVSEIACATASLISISFDVEIDAHSDLSRSRSAINASRSEINVATCLFKDAMLSILPCILV